MSKQENEVRCLRRYVSLIHLTVLRALSTVPDNVSYLPGTGTAVDDFI